MMKTVLFLLLVWCLLGLGLLAPQPSSPPIAARHSAGPQLPQVTTVAAGVGSNNSGDTSISALDVF